MTKDKILMDSGLSEDKMNMIYFDCREVPRFSNGLDERIELLNRIKEVEKHFKVVAWHMVKDGGYDYNSEFWNIYIFFKENE